MSRKEMIRFDNERLCALFTAYGTTPTRAAAMVGLGSAYFSNANKRGLISTTTIAALKSIGIDITPALIVEQPEKPEQEEKTEPAETTINVVLTLSPETLKTLESYSYDRSKDAERIIAAIKELAARWA